MTYYHALDCTTELTFLSEYKNYTSKVSLELAILEDGELLSNYIIVSTNEEIE